MWIRQAALALIGLSAGFVISGGVFALVTSTGLMPRLAGKSHTGKWVRLYESMVILGGTFGNIFFIYEISLGIENFAGYCLLAMFGFFSGIFVGCLAVSLSEAVNTTAIFARRAKLRQGLSFIVMAIALGKMIGTIIQFVSHWQKLS